MFYNVETVILRLCHTFSIYCQESADHVQGIILVILKVLDDWLQSLGVQPFSRVSNTMKTIHSLVNLCAECTCYA